MRKLIIALLSLAFVLTACTDISEAPVTSELFSSEDTTVSSQSESADSPADESMVTTDEESSERIDDSSESQTETTEETTTETTDVSKEETADETSEAPPAEPSEVPDEPDDSSFPVFEPNVDVKEAMAKIDSISSSDFVTNIEAGEKLEELRKYLESTDFGVFYCDLNCNTYIAYGCDRVFRTASTSKLPYIKYLCTLADENAVDIGEKLVYEERFHNIGSGIIKDDPVGGSYTVEKLMKYTLKYSDNIAYSMLIDRYGVSGYNLYLESMGVDYRCTAAGYGNCTASQMAALMFDVGNYVGEHKYIIMESSSDASYNHQIGKELSEYVVLQKYGAIKPGQVAYHDIAVVYAERPYVLTIYTKIDFADSSKNRPFRKIARMIDDINKELTE